MSGYSFCEVKKKLNEAFKKLQEFELTLDDINKKDKEGVFDRQKALNRAYKNLNNILNDLGMRQRALNSTRIDLSQPRMDDSAVKCARDSLKKDALWAANIRKQIEQISDELAQYEDAETCST
jgi:hypothetical protein